ncbi:3-deoxy-manno-octulosonate cytidylyltransferase, partial [Candidatus Pelagibacter ubique]|nr:3-deoxy-manno-octulosonate cytidylyltransferase [Candidatus Pelagibacter ubique]
MRTCIIIPARYRSTRFPGKPLVSLLGKPMIVWVAELSARAVGKSNVYIATEDDRIKSEIKKFGFNVVMTSDKALTGTDRVAEVSKQINFDVYLNVQGDEPLVMPEDIIKIRDAKLLNMDMIVNGFTWVSNDENPENINLPKLVTNEKNELIYMSRLAVPGFKQNKFKPPKYKKQVCIYAFTKNELEAFHSFGRKSNLEKSEDIEILRFFELKKKILMVETNSISLAVDVPEDIPKAEEA